jgi:N,N-dimethylformamidase
MTIATHIPIRGARRRTGLAAAFAAVAATALLASLSAERDTSQATLDDLTEIIAEHDRLEELEEEVERTGRAPVRQQRRPDGIEAAFGRESYGPGAVARLVIGTHLRRLRLQILRAGVEPLVTRRNDVMNGVPVTGVRSIGAALSVRVHIGDWPSGLYVARLSSPGRVGFAPFVVRPRRLGTNPIAVVLPTFTWQAYNFRDDDGDGRSDTWYANWRSRTVKLNRPYLDRGVPPNYRVYDLPFLRWLHETGREVDVLAQADLDRLRSGAALARYELLVFPGHHEYVTRREYRAVTDFRNRGGNLAFLSANNFFWRVDRRGDSLKKVRLWRDLGRPEAALIGAQYLANDRGQRRGSWIVRRTPATAWLFAGTGSAPGERFSEAGIEIDRTAPASPPGTQVVAEIPRVYGPGYTAQMTYYETRRGAKVFAAGAFTLAGSVRQPAVQRLLSNLLDRLGADPDPAGSEGGRRSSGRPM